jgi:hypothetical protein
MLSLALRFAPPLLAAALALAPAAQADDGAVDHSFGSGGVVTQSLSTTVGHPDDDAGSRPPGRRRHRLRAEPQRSLPRPVSPHRRARPDHGQRRHRARRGLQDDTNSFTDTRANAAALLPGNRIAVAGSAKASALVSSFLLAIYDLDGHPLSRQSFSPRLPAEANDVIADPD